MLSAIQDYFAFWQGFVVLAIFLAWALGGGLLFRRSVLADLSRKTGKLDRCLVVSFLATVAGGVAGVVVLLIVLKIGKVAGFEARWPAVILSIVSFLLFNYVVLYVAFALPARRVFRSMLTAYAAPTLFALVLAVPSAWYALSCRQEQVAEDHSVNALRLIYRVLYDYARKREPAPASLRALVDNNIVEPAILQCRANAGRDVDYFYLPQPIPLREADAPAHKILACDFIDNHGGRGRAVLFTNGAAEWYPVDRLPEVFDLPENRDFVAALGKAEAELKLK